MLQSLINFKLSSLVVTFAVLMSASCTSQGQTTSWNQMDIRADLYALRNSEIGANENIPNRNQLLLNEINSFPIKASSERLGGISLEQAQQLVMDMGRHPVVGYNQALKYDPESRIGFCFGKAIFAHLELLRRGVSKEAIKKAFIVGPLYSAGINWQFHVATIVRANDRNGWYALDAFIGRPVPLEEWLQRFQSYSLDGKARMYITNPEKIGPSAWEYNKRPYGLGDGFYNNYFNDMFHFFKQNPIQEYQKFSVRCHRLLL